MHLSELSVVNFKNIEDASVSLAEKVNCFLGNNGAGKTTMLDSIYYLAFCKSFFNPIDSQNIRHDHEFFVIDGKFVLEGEEERIFCGLKRNEKKRFKRNQKEYSRLADHIGVIPLVMIAPSDGELIREGSDVRRKFMEVINNLRPAIDPRGHSGGGGGGGGGRRFVVGGEGARLGSPSWPRGDVAP